VGDTSIRNAQDWDPLAAEALEIALSGAVPRRYRWPGNGPRSLPLDVELR
jgi:hypothetical protein